jgi:hypothetical protein
MGVFNANFIYFLDRTARLRILNAKFNTNSRVEDFFTVLKQFSIELLRAKVKYM